MGPPASTSGRLPDESSTAEVVLTTDTLCSPAQNAPSNQQMCNPEELSTEKHVLSNVGPPPSVQTTTQPSSRSFEPEALEPAAAAAPATSASASVSQSKITASPKRIYLMCMADFGLAFTWVLKYAVTTPYFEHTLRGGPVVSHFVWSLGPLSGLVTAPVVGVLSDRSRSRFGRRRPYMFGGMVAAIVGMAVFAGAGRISYRPLALTVAVVGFAVLDFSSNVIMFPSRALMGDLLVPEQQHDVQSAAAVISSVAEICAGLYIYSLDAPVTDIETLFLAAAVILAATVCISVVMCPEQVHREEESSITPSNKNTRCLQPDEDADREGRPVSGASDEITNKPRTKFSQNGRYVHLADTVENDVNIGDENDVVIAFQSNRMAHLPDSVKSDHSCSPDGSLSVYQDKSEIKQARLMHKQNEEVSPHSVTPCPDNIVVDVDSRNMDVNPLLSDGCTILTGSEGQNQIDVASERNRVADHLKENLTERYRNNSWSVADGERGLRETILNVKAVMTSAVLNFPRPLAKVGVVYFIAWACWFTCLPVYSDWLGQSVLGGDPKAAVGTDAAVKYQKGVTIFSLASICKAFIALAFSTFYPSMVRLVGNLGERVVFGVPFILFSMVLWFAAFTHRTFVAGAVIILGAVPFIATQTIPIAIAVSKFSDNMASNLGILNLFCVSAQLLDTFYTGFVAKRMGEAMVVRVASVWALAAGVAAFLLL